VRYLYGSRQKNSWPPFSCVNSPVVSFNNIARIYNEINLIKHSADDDVEIGTISVSIFHVIHMGSWSIGGTILAYWKPCRLLRRRQSNRDDYWWGPGTRTPNPRTAAVPTTHVWLVRCCSPEGNLRALNGLNTSKYKFFL